jgi:hypothetical protein
MSLLAFKRPSTPPPEGSIIEMLPTRNARGGFFCP